MQNLIKIQLIRTTKIYFRQKKGINLQKSCSRSDEASTRELLKFEQVHAETRNLEGFLRTRSYDVTIHIPKIGRILHATQKP
jgi:hypothetical protein